MPTSTPAPAPTIYEKGPRQRRAPSSQTTLRLPGISASIIPTHVMWFGVEVELHASLDIKTTLRAVFAQGGHVTRTVVRRSGGDVEVSQ